MVPGLSPVTAIRTFSLTHLFGVSWIMLLIVFSSGPAAGHR
ncbi:hypothetical protein SPAB_02200 [Salmonella enterica subsp. enterica serovar Paratyphi B str. SPB7]|uniref:Uncharacterized protein n=1 Tax=Salmonella paratyphi B (strain ATCC BAA-1250 / SPB7) TaxID=1016998 RepID=A0A6C6Z1X8_SALPB|nr:hypothetical protein SPAB_02200 [Salmonella enterica subsp. enterica serovar Paratyphi B str. SPB7]